MTMDSDSSPSEKIDEIEDDLEEEAITLGQQIDAFVNDQPMRAVLIALVTGILIGKVIL